MHVKFFQYLNLHTGIFTSKKTDTFNTIKLKIGLRYPLRETHVVKGRGGGGGGEWLIAIGSIMCGK